MQQVDFKIWQILIFRIVISPQFHINKNKKMKNNPIIYFLFLLLFIACNKDDDRVVDEVSEFVFFTTEEYSMNELTNSTEGNEIEIHAEMLATKRSADIVLELAITGNNASAGTDYEVVSSTNTLVIPAGSTTSVEPFKIKAVNNGASSTEERSVSITINAVSDASLNIGRGFNNPTLKTTKIIIVDDECPDDISIFNNAEWAFTGANTVYYSDYGGTFITRINGDKMTIIGDIANYDLGIGLVADIIPNPDAPTTGTIVFNEEGSTVGNDGTYDYRWNLNEVGTYDICARSIKLSTTIQYIDIFGPDPTAWVDWYVSNIEGTISALGSDDPVPPSGSVGENVSAFPEEVITVTGAFLDAQGLSEITIQNAVLGIDKTISLAGELMYELSEDFTIPSMAEVGDYEVLINVTNIEGLSTPYSLMVTVKMPVTGECTSDFTVFDGATLTANASVTETDGSFDPYDFTNSNTATLDGDQLTIAGNFIDFFDTQFTLLLTPDENDPTIGTASFTEQSLGTHTDGYSYRLVSPEEGTYNACTGKINITYTMEYDDGTNWVFYYKVVTEFTL